MAILPAVAGTSVDSATDATSYTQGGSDWTPDEGVVYLVAVNSEDGATEGTLSWTGTGSPTFTSLGARSWDSAGTPNKRLQVWRFLASGLGAGKISVDFGVDTQLGCNLHVIALPGAKTSGTNGADAIVQVDAGVNDTGATSGPPGLTLASFADAVNNVCLMFVAHEGNENSTVQTDFTELVNASGHSLCTMISQYKVGEVTDCTGTSWATSSRAGGIALEIAAAEEEGGVVVGTSTSNRSTRRRRR